METVPHSLEVGLVGCDHPHSSSHLSTLLSLDEVAVVHLWDPDPHAAAKLAEQAGEKLGPVHTSLDSLLSDDDVVWLLVNLRNDIAPGVMAQIAAAGKPVLAEKPIGRSFAETSAVVKAFREAELSLSICFQNRYKPAAQMIRGWLAAQHLGRICAAETKLHTTQVALRNPRHWLFDRALSGGGILPWLGCHYLDLLRYTTGLEPVAVTAQVATLSGESIDVEDMAVMTIGLSNGALATASFGYLMPGGRPGYLTPGYDTHFGLKGTDGHLAWAIAADEQVVDAYSRHPSWRGAASRRFSLKEEPAQAYGNRYGLEFARDALHAALIGEDGPATGEDLLVVWKLIEAAHRSSETGARQTV